MSPTNLAADDLTAIAEGLFELDPMDGYAERGAALVARAGNARSYSFERGGAKSDSAIGNLSTNTKAGAISLPVEYRGTVFGTFYAELGDDSSMSLVRWAVRLYARGLDYVSRLDTDMDRIAEEAIAGQLDKAPLTTRERDVVRQLIAGSSTRQIASETGLTVSTINTYLKRIFAKLEVHSRVELIAKLTGASEYESLRPSRLSGIFQDRMTPAPKFGKT